jgi:hypothetical protein
VVATLAVSLISRNATWFGFGSPGTCGSSSLNGLSLSIHGNTQFNLGPGMTATPDSMELCASHPRLEQRILVTLTQAPTFVLYLAVLASLVPLALIACGLFTVARIMRAGTRMHDDLAGTV